MEIRLASEKDRRGVYEALGYCFNHDKDSIERNIKDGPLNTYEQFIVAVNEKEEVLSTFSVVPFTINFEEKQVNFGGVAGVSSLPEHRGEGNIASLFRYALKYMKDKNMILSGLGPFAFQYYRKMGYEWCFTWQLVNIPIDDLKSFPAAYKYVEIKEENFDKFDDFRNKVNKKVNGPVIRDAHIIENKKAQYKNRKSRIYAALDENDEMLSVMVYHQEGKEIKVTEMYYTSELSRQYLLNFLYRHRSMTTNIELTLTTDDEIRNILPSPRISYWHWPYMMGRVVMVKEALQLLNVEEFDGSYTIKVNDNLADWNDKIFKISYKNGSLEVNVCEEEVDFEISIQRFSQLVFGHIGATQALKLDLIKVNNKEKIKALEKTFTKRTTMLYQEF